MIFTNGRVVLSDRVADGLNVAVKNGKISAISAPSDNSSDADNIDLKGDYLAPGFIDLHIHGGAGRDTMEASEEAFRAICRYHATGGTTSLLLTTATAPIPEIVDVLHAIEQHASTLPQILGAHVEGPFISPEKNGAQRAEFIRTPTSDLIKPLLECSRISKIVTLAPELPGAIEFIDQLVERDIRVSGGHSDAWDEEARAAFDHGMRQVTHTFNCMSTARKRGIHRVAGLLEFALSEPEVLCELIADGHHVSATLMKLLYQAKGADGICLVTDATAGAGLANGSRFFLAGVECVVADGVCLLADRSAIAGSASQMIDLVRTMVNMIGVPLHEAIAMATASPARALGLGGRKGRLQEGADADLVVLSPALQVVQTYCRAELVHARSAGN